MKKQALPPEEFARLLSEALRLVAKRLSQPVTLPVALLHAYRELMLLRQKPTALTTGKLAPYPRQLFVLELSLLNDERPVPTDDEGMSIALEPATLAKETVRIYSKQLGDYRRVGRLQLQKRSAKK